MLRPDEQSFHEVMDAIPHPVVLARVEEDGGVRFIWMNPAYEALVSVDKERIIGRRPEEFLPPRAAAVVNENYALCLEKKAAQTYDRTIMIDGETHYVRVTLNPVFNKGGDITHVVSSGSDIHEFVEQASEAARIYSDLKNLNRELSLLTGLTAHDLRSPLAGVAALLDDIMASGRGLSDHNREMLSACGALVRGLIDQATQALSHARSLEAAHTPPGRLELDRTMADLSAILDPESRFDITHPGGCVSVEKVVLQLCLRNLLDNAIKHAKSRIHVALGPARPGFLRVTVSDDGPGFEAGELTLDKADDLASGYGLGAVRRLVEARDGELWIAKPAFGAGASVAFTLPGRILDAADETESLTPAEAVKERLKARLAKAGKNLFY